MGPINLWQVAFPDADLYLDLLHTTLYDNVVNRLMRPVLARTIACEGTFCSTPLPGK
jgi:hypothetical protein